MSDRLRYFLRNSAVRKNAEAAVRQAPDNYVVEIRPQTRSLEQNAKLHAMLGELARQLPWHGQRLTPDDWKKLFAASMQGLKIVPGLDPGTFVPIGLRTRDMSVAEMADMITLIEAFGAEHSVTFSDVAREYA